ncbi:MAG: hypothetical protein AAF357_08040, partial [Verrucomicrobiota bacterium]
MKALENLEAEVASEIVPVIDVHRNLNPDKELDKHLDSVCGQIARSWQNGHFVFDLFDLDASLRIDSGEHPARYTFDRLLDAGLSFIPCSGLDRDDAYNEQVLEMVSENQSIAIRLQREDVQAPVFSIPQMSELIEYFGTDPSRVIVLLDFREIIANPIVLASECAQFIDEVSEMGEWEALVLSG